MESFPSNSIKIDPSKIDIEIEEPPKTSDKLLGRLKNSSQSMSCTTTYYSQRLPQIEILNEYQKRYSHLHSTGLSKEDKYSYGVLEYVFDLFGARNVHIKRHGNACKITNDLTS